MIRRINDPSSVEDRSERFAVGQLVCHRRYRYRGVVIAVDATCQASDTWYQRNRTQPSRQQPWYHVLVDGSDTTTYPAQENLLADTSGEAVDHPLVGQFFERFENGRYIPIGQL